MYQREAVKEQQTLLKKEECTLECVKQKPTGNPTHTKTKVPLCSRCGKSHARDHYPAKDLTCYMDATDADILARCDSPKQWQWYQKTSLILTTMPKQRHLFATLML